MNSGGTQFNPQPVLCETIGKESRMSPDVLDWATRKMELPFTKKGKVVRGAGGWENQMWNRRKK